MLLPLTHSDRLALTTNPQDPHTQVTRPPVQDRSVTQVQVGACCYYQLVRLQYLAYVITLHHKTRKWRGLDLAFFMAYWTDQRAP